MIEVTGSAQRTAWFERSFPPTERVSAHVWSIPVVCDPFPVRYTLAYVIANDAGAFVIVDPGWDSRAGRTQLESGIRAAGLSAEGLVGVVVTHFHPDHVGMAQVIADTTGAWIGMHPLDTFRRESPDDVSPTEFTVAVEADRRWLERCGVPDSTLRAMLLTEGALRAFGTAPKADIALAGGDVIALEDRTIEVVWTPGHSAGHLCLIDHDDALVLTGDHVLPRISPNVGIGFHDTDRDPVGEYLASLAAIAHWDAFEVCPAHEWRFTGLDERCRELTAHHRERSAEVRAVLAVDPHASAWQVAERLTWSRGWSNLNADGVRGALAETLAHLRHLERTQA